VIHFDSHLDTWKPKVFGGSPSKVASVNHGTYFYHASQEGLLANDSNIHAGIRTTLSGPSDYENDGYCGFEIVEAREIDTIGMNGIIKKIKDRVGTTKPVYLSIDIDTLDPACKMIHSSTLVPLLTNSSRTCDRYSRDGWLVHTRTPYYFERFGRNQPHRS
jgi:agmatinase